MTGITRYWRRVVSSGLCGPIVVLFASLALLYNVNGTRTMGVSEGAYGPLSWPLFVLVVLTAGMILLCGIRMRELLANGFAPQQSEQRTEEGGFRVLVAAALIALYGLGFAYLGFLLSTVVFLALWLLFARYRKPVRVALISLLGTILPLYLLIKVAYTPLPRGVGSFEQITLQLYQWLRLF